MTRFPDRHILLHHWNDLFVNHIKTNSLKSTLRKKQNKHWRSL